MKTRFFIYAALLGSLLIIPFLTNLAQGSNSQIKSYLQAGNATALSGMFASSVDVSINGNDDTFDKSTAAQKIQQFFQQNQPKTFTIKHEGAAPDGSKFVIGSLGTQQSTYRVHVVIRQNSITSISIDR